MYCLVVQILAVDEEQSYSSGTSDDDDDDDTDDDDDDTGDDDTGDDSEGDSCDDGRKDDEEGDDDGTTSKYVRPPKKGTEIRLMELQMSKGVATLQATTLKLTLQCTRCKCSQDVIARAHR